MANVWGILTEAEIELINSLGQEDIPTKLRCAICSKLAANAYKLPCCGQLIDGRCHSTLPSTCPVCEHNPLSAADCNPNKAMRSTIKVFLKTEMKKRENSRPKEPQESVVPKPSAQSIAPQSAVDPAEAAVSETLQSEPIPDAAPSSVAEAATKVEEVPVDATNTEATPDTSAAPGETNTEQEQSNTDPIPATEAQAEDGDREQTVDPENGQGVADQEVGTMMDGGNQQTMDTMNGSMNDTMNNGMNAGFGYNAMGGAAPNMNFAGGDMNQMQMMMAMQNGMMPNGFNFPMMGMDPMMQNQMYMASGGFGNQGMGMNGMNMMGGGYGGNATGSNNWNGQQSWGGGQDNYNHPNASGMGNGDYYNSGFPQAGFNHQGNFGGQQSTSYNMNRGYGRGRGRGRGFYGAQGRGGYNNLGQNQGYGQGYQNQQQDMQQYGMNGQNQDSQATSYQQHDTPRENTGSSANVDEYGRQLRPEVESGSENAQPQDGAAADDAATAEVKPGTDEPTADTSDRVASASGDLATNEPSNKSGSQDIGIGAAKPNLTLDSSLPLRTGDAFMSPALGSAKSGRDGSMGPPALPQPSVPFNAPSGPKAMRQGLPNTSLLHLRARGLLPDGKPQSPRTSDGLQSPSGNNSPHHADAFSRRASEQHPRDRPRGRDRRDDDDRRSDSASSRGGSRDREDSHRRKRQRSTSMSDEERDSGRHRRSKHHHSRKDSTQTDHESRSARSRDRKHGDRSRSASPDEKKSSHRSSRRDRDSEKRRDRDKDHTHSRKDSTNTDHEPRSARSRDRKHGDRSRSASPDDKRSSHRSSRRDRDSEKRRDRDKDRDRDRDRKDRRDRDRDRHRDRDRDRERDRKKSTDEPPTPKEPSFNPPTGPKGPPTGPKGARSIFDVNIKGVSLKTNSTQPSRRSSQASATTPTASTPVDAYAAERERRQQERLIAETKKLAGMANFAGVKRPSEGDADVRGRRKRTAREAVNVDDVNERLRRGEAEREARRH